MINGFTVENWKLNLFRHPIEDSYLYDENIIAVADGITRDPRNMPIISNNLSGMVEFTLRYPRPSPARLAADLFCETFVDSIKQFDNKDKNAVLESFKLSNKELFKLNVDYFKSNNLYVDYLENDLLGCVGAGTVLNKGILSYGFIADCRVFIFDEKGNMTFSTSNEGPNSKGSIDQDVKDKFKTEFRYPEGRVIIRERYRNNPSQPLSYGALTGELSASSYIRTGEVELKPEEILIVSTDGLEKEIESGAFSDNIRNKDFEGIKRLCKKSVRTEGTLVHLLNQ